MNDIKDQLHDMTEKITDLQLKTEHLTNGQRYAAINEIEKSIGPLRNDLHKLEHKLYSQQHTDEETQRNIERILVQIADLENIKSDLIQRINTETEHTRKFYHDETMSFLKEEISPLRDAIIENKQEIGEIKILLHDLDKKIIESDKERQLQITQNFEDLDKKIIKVEKERQLKDAEKFDHFKIGLTAVIAALGGLSALSLYFQPAIQTLIRILFGI